jgi:hypothetical protein
LAKIVPADPGWHVVRVHVTRDKTVAIEWIKQITHWDQSGFLDRPMQDGDLLYIDPCELRGVFFASYLMDPLGRLLRWDLEVVANSVHDLNERYVSWRSNVHGRLAPGDGKAHLASQREGQGASA